MSLKTSRPLEKISRQWVQLDLVKYQVELDHLLGQVSSLIDTSLSIATRLQGYRAWLLELELPDSEMT